MKNTTWLIVGVIIVFFGSLTILMEQRPFSTEYYMRRWLREAGSVHDATPELRKRLDRTCDPRSLSKWAELVLSEPSNSRPPSQFFGGLQLAPEEIPNCALEIFQGGPVIAAAIEQAEDKRWVTIALGNGKEQFGLIITPRPIPLPNDRNVFYVRWVDGVFLWHDRPESERKLRIR